MKTQATNPTQTLSQLLFDKTGIPAIKSNSIHKVDLVDIQENLLRKLNSIINIIDSNSTTDCFNFSDVANLLESLVEETKLKLLLAGGFSNE